MTDSELLEKAIRDYPIGTKIKSIYNKNIHICNTKPFIFTCPGYIYVNDENKTLRCLYDKTENKWAEIINQNIMTNEEFNSWAEIINQNIMTQQEFKDLKVGDFISNYEIIHKYKEFLIVKCDDGHDLFDLPKINKLKLTPKTFLGLKIGNYDCVPVEIDGPTLAYLLEVKSYCVKLVLYKNGVSDFNHIPTSIRLL